jgi:hypothetical protein
MIEVSKQGVGRLTKYFLYLMPVQLGNNVVISIARNQEIILGNKQINFFWRKS